MARFARLIQIVIVVVTLGLLAQLAGVGGASWAAPGQDEERQTVPSFTPTSPPPTPTSDSPTSPPPKETPTLAPGTTPTPTPTPTTTTTGQVTAQDDTDVYRGPGTDYEIIGTLKAGAKAPVLGRNADSSWWQIAFRRGIGWVPATAVTADPQAQDAPVVSAPAAETGTVTPAALPQAGGGSGVLWGGALLLVNGACLFLAGYWARRRREA